MQPKLLLQKGQPKIITTPQCGVKGVRWPILDCSEVIYVHVMYSMNLNSGVCFNYDK